MITTIKNIVAFSIQNTPGGHFLGIDIYSYYKKE